MRPLPLALALILSTTPLVAQDQPAFEIRETAGDTAPALAMVIDVFAKTFAETCSWALGGDPDAITPQIYEMSYAEPWDEPGTPAHPFVLYEFFCSAGAYNTQTVFMGWDDSWGLRPMNFALPTLDIQYEEDKQGDGNPPLRGISILGYASNPTLTNASYDPQTRSVVSNSYWRGLGDASSIATYELIGTDFVLKSYAVDPTYDGEINLISAVDFAAPADVPLIILPPSADIATAP